MATTKKQMPPQNTTLISPNEIAAVVILYHPDENVLENIYSYINQVAFIFAIDNTEPGQQNIDLLREIHKNQKIAYIFNQENLGIAAALNIGAREAIQSGYSFLLTMDQDSTASPAMITDLTTCATRKDLQTIGILSPFHSTATDPLPPTDAVIQVLTAWTSGSLLNLRAYKETGPFSEDLFIDFVDHEYCLRLNRAGYKILKVGKAILKHHIGNNLRRHKFLWASPVASNHSALRRYYITRNRFYIASKFKTYFPRFFRDDFLLFLKELIVIFLFEKNVAHKYKMIIRGFWDYKRGILGKYRD